VRKDTPFPEVSKREWKLRKILRKAVPAFTFGWIYSGGNARIKRAFLCEIKGRNLSV
jgi:hypothetical protein